MYKLCHFLQKRRFAKKAMTRPLHVLYEEAQIHASQKLKDSEFLVIDCEMSGLKAEKNQLLSIGWVTVSKNRIINASTRYFLVHAEKGTGETTKIHGLMETSIAGASSIASVLLLLIKQMPGKILVFHHAPLDIHFLQRAALHHFQCPLLFSYVDTMEIEKKRMELQGKTTGLRLVQCRERYGLSSDNQHNALADAFATAELLLAQTSYIGDREKLQLKDLGVKSTCFLNKLQ